MSAAELRFQGPFSISVLSHSVHVRVFALVAAEGAMANATLRLVSLHDPFSGPVIGPATWPMCVLYAGAFTVCAGAMGLYSRGLRDGLVGLTQRLAAAAIIVYVLMQLEGRAFPSVAISPSCVTTALVVTVGMGVLLRSVGGAVIGGLISKRRVLVYGAGRQASAIASLRRRSDRLGYTIVGFLPTDADQAAPSGLTVIDTALDLPAFCREHDVDEVVVATDDRRRAFPVHELLQCRLDGVQIVELVSFLERESGRVQLDVLNPSWFIFSGGFRRTALGDALGRLFDVVVALTLLAVVWPVMLVTALAIKIENGLHAPVLYRQQRVGLNGKHFNLRKFRSMRTDAEADGIARWAKPDDKRVTRVGRFIRRSYIDELPQLVSVLRGEMRFVGPRPERPEFVTLLSERIPYYSERHCVPPGLTGWAQLRYPYGATEHDAIEKLQYDLYYVKNRSLIFDLMILLQTVGVILFGRGAR